jgi:hypothetical protein
MQSAGPELSLLSALRRSQHRHPERPGGPAGAVASVTCWITNIITRVSAATRVWKMISHRVGSEVATLTATHPPAALMASTAAQGLDAYRSTRDSQNGRRRVGWEARAAC